MKIDHKIKKKIYRLHKKHQLHHRTIFYMKKGRKLHFHSRIIKESLKILVVASVVSTIGGVSLQALGEKLVVFVPLLILLPALNHMTGSFGAIVSSRFAMDLYLGRVSRSWWKSRRINALLKSIMITSVLTALYISMLSAVLAVYKGFEMGMLLFFKIVLISVATTVIIVGTVFFISVIAGLYIYSKKKDPNNFLIPLTTSLADLGSMVMFSALIILLI